MRNVCVGGKPFSGRVTVILRGIGIAGTVEGKRGVKPSRYALVYSGLVERGDEIRPNVFSLNFRPASC